MPSTTGAGDRAASARTGTAPTRRPSRFDLHVGDTGEDGWTGAAYLWGEGLPAALAAVREHRGAPNDAVAGSLLLMSYGFALTGPVLRGLYRDRSELGCTLDAVRVRREDARVAGVRFAAGPVPAADGAAARVAAELFAGNLAHAVDAVHLATRASRRTLWSNVATDVGTAFLYLSWPCDDHAAYVGAAREILDLEPRLDGLVDVLAAEHGGQDWMYVRRNVCCLAFRTSLNQEQERHYCGHCNLLDEATRFGLFTEAAARFTLMRAARDAGPSALE
ncbi:hypothetical protein [Pseudonocardia sp. N23]|uniref:hypothetical protein n=1 Tax=Pseudonocardia sp. N23 TaxID=1987376 RepID=UPI0011452BCC|nr:hypothetical protein [Pseudonocardia sp. N23]